MRPPDAERPGHPHSPVAAPLTTHRPVQSDLRQGTSDRQPAAVVAIGALEDRVRRRRAFEAKAALVHELRVLLLEHDRGGIDGATFLSEVGRVGNAATRLYLNGWRYAA